MENSELFKTIEQLKETLTEISSARQQVIDTVSAYAQTQKEIHSYTKNLKEIEDALSQLISLLQNNKITIEHQSSSVVSNLKKSCDIVLTKTKDELATASHKYTEDTAANIELMRKQIERFDHIMEKADQLASRIQTSVSSQIQTVNEAMIGTTASLSNLERSLEKQEAMLESFSTNSSSIADDIAKINVLCNNSQNSVKSYCNNLQASIDFLNKESKNLQQTVSSETQKNKYLCVAILIGVIISIILKFVV